MERGCGNSMKSNIVKNILSSVVEKMVSVGSQLIVVMVLIRSLTREEYGALGVMVGYFTFLAVINISLETIIIRDHSDYEEDLPGYFSKFSRFNVIKSVVLIVVSGCVGYGLSVYYQNSNFLFATICLVSVMVADAIVAPIAIYTSAKFKQEIVTKLNSVRSVLNLMFLIGLWFFPTLKYWAIKEVSVSLVYVGVWLCFACRYYRVPLHVLIGFGVKRDNFVRKSLLGYSIWTHLNGVVTNFIYRSDTFFLSMFITLSTIGNYNIALNSANIANILPMILCYQNGVALSHAKSKEEAHEICNMFFIYSLCLGLLTLVFFVLFGKYYIWFMTGELGQQNSEINFYMICIVVGLVIVKAFAGPVVSYITIFGSVKNLVYLVSAPVLVITAVSYFFFAKYYGAYGVALANIINSVVWILLLFLNGIKAGYRFPSLKELSSIGVRNV